MSLSLHASNVRRLQQQQQASNMAAWFAPSTDLFSSLGFGNFMQMQQMSQMMTAQTQASMAQIMQNMMSQPPAGGDAWQQAYGQGVPGAGASAMQGYMGMGGMDMSMFGMGGAGMGAGMFGMGGAGMGAGMFGGMLPFGGGFPMPPLGPQGGITKPDMNWVPPQGYFPDNRRYIGPAHPNEVLTAYGIPGADRLPPRTQAFLTAALSKQGKPYVPGACGPASFDCSGLVISALRDVGVKNPPGAARFQQAAYPAVRKEDLKPGDLVYFWFPNNRGIEPPKASHVEIYLGNGKTMATDGRNNPSRIKDMNWKAFIGANRVPELQQ